MPWKLFKGFCLKLGGVLVCLHAEATITITDITLSQTGVLASPAHEIDLNDMPNGVEVSCSRDNNSTSYPRAIYGYDCTTTKANDGDVHKTNISITVTTTGNDFIDIFSNDGSLTNDKNITETLKEEMNDTGPFAPNGAESTLTFTGSFGTWFNAKTASEGDTKNITITFAGQSGSDQSDTTDGIPSGADTQTLTFVLDNQAPTTATEAQATLDFKVEAADQKIIVGGFSFDDDSIKYQFYLRETTSTTTCDGAASGSASFDTDYAFGAANIESGATIAKVMASSNQGVTFSGLTNNTKYCLAYAVADRATNIDHTAPPQVLDAIYEPNGVFGLISEPLSCTHAGVDNGRGGGGMGAMLELAFWAVLGVLIAQTMKRRKRRLGYA